MTARYGAEVAGGAEALCRGTARALAGAGHELTVLTTTARDLGWRDHFPGGSWLEDGAVVRRFPAAAGDPARAEAIARRLALDPGDPALERRWSLAGGPVAPDLLAALAAARAEHEAVVFWGYLPATTHLGVGLVADRAVIVPTAHPEPMLRFSLVAAALGAAAGLAFLTPQERELVADLHGLGDRPAHVVGAGLDPPPVGPAATPSGLPSRFVLYLGRIEGAKGIAALVAGHRAHRESNGELGLVLAGRSAGDLRPPAWIHQAGFVSEAERATLLAAAEVVVLPSPYESLSLTALEAWQAGVPTLANARSAVLAGQTARSGGGLVYDSPAGYASALARLAADPALRARLGAAGAAFAATQTWAACTRRWEALLAEVRRPLMRSVPRAGRPSLA